MGSAGKESHAALFGQLVLRMQAEQAAMLQHWAMLGQLAWLVMVEPMIPFTDVETSVQRALRDQRARTDRLVQRGVPRHLAQQGLRVLPAPER